MHKTSKYLLVIVVILGFIGCDQQTKSLARQELEFSGPAQYLGGFIRFQLAENEGGFLSIGANLPVSLRKSITILLGIITLAGFGALLTTLHKLTVPALVSFSLIIAGASGNLIDRFFHHGRVIDFIIVGTQTLHTGIFNIADMLLMAGMCMVLIERLFYSKSTS